MSNEIWVEENYKNFYATRFKMTKKLYSGKSDFQQIDVVDTLGHGRMLFNEGMAMVSEKDEFIYHEMISHVPLLTHPNPEQVLVIGGGDGGTVREVLRQPRVEKVWQVEIDQMVTEICQKFIPQTAACLTDPRVVLKFEDGVSFVRDYKEKFDVVLVDSTDPVGPAAPLFGVEFFKNVKKILSEDGMVVAQAGSPFYEMDQLKSLNTILKEVFPVVKFYQFTNMTYPGGFWTFAFASMGLDPIKNFQPDRIRRIDGDLKWYNEGIHRAAFELPEFLKRELG